jgi:uncharacterized membrane protein YcaP (DUF421 family)
MENYLDIVLRTISVYLFIILAIRLFGKTELAQLSVTDLVFILLISNSVQNAMVGPDTSLVGGLTAAGGLFILNFIIKRVTYKNKSINKFLQGEPILLVHDGVILKSHLEKVRLTEEELLAAMREHGVDSIQKVNLAVLEADGNISILSDNYQQRSSRKRRPHKVIRKD